jgi:hypothetical protein
MLLALDLVVMPWVVVERNGLEGRRDRRRQGPARRAEHVADLEVLEPLRWDNWIVRRIERVSGEVMDCEIPCASAGCAPASGSHDHRQRAAAADAPTVIRVRRPMSVVSVSISILLGELSARRRRSATAPLI